MKILMLTHYFYPRIGGVEKVVKKLSENLKGHEVSIITEKHDEMLKDVEDFNRWTVVHRFSYPHKKFIGLLYIWKWMWTKRKLIEKSDIVHVHDVFIWYLPFRILFPFKPVYMTYHGWEGELPIPLQSLIQKKLAYYLSKKTMVVGKHLEKYNHIKADAITYNGMDIPNKVSKKIRDTFVYVGRLSRETGLHLVLDTLSQLKNIDIEFIGDGELREECVRYGKVHGFIQDPTPYLAKAEFCFAGGYLTALDAFANKCFVFVCYQNKIKEDYFKMAPFAKYMVIEDSSDALLKRLKYYKTQKKQRIKQVEEAYNWVKDKTWEKVVDQYKMVWGIN
jgi:glycosyltransferase involved in cell wall biosynthesis